MTSDIPHHGRSFIELRNVVKSYESPAGTFTALKGVSLKIEAGQFVAIIGKSGSGKSTLINMLSAIDRATSGEVFVGDTGVHKLNEKQLAAWRGDNVGIVFQFFQLLPMLTVLENIILPMDLRNTYRNRQERREKAMHLLSQMEISDHAQKLPRALSGGQQQRVAIARALANNPRLIVADEPTGNLDSQTAEKVFALFQTLAAEGRTILMVTHDGDLAQRVHRSVVLADGQIVQDQLTQQPGYLVA